MFWFCFQVRLFTERIKNIKADATKMSSIDKFTGRAYFHVVPPFPTAMSVFVSVALIFKGV